MSNLQAMARDLGPLILRNGGARVYNSATISHATSGANQAVTFNSERYDDADYHSTVSNTSRLTAPAPGRYLIGGCVTFAANVTGVRYLQIRLNGATFIAIQGGLALTGGLTSILTVETIYELAAGDYAELVAYQDSGAALNMTAAGNYSPEFWIARL